MPRKKSPDAEAKAQKAQEARWRYFLRNPDFHKDLQKLHRLYCKGAEIKKWLDELERIADKWGFLRIPPHAIAILPLLNKTALESYGAEWGVSYTPVVTTELKEDRFLFFRIDLEHPLEDLLSLIEKELREVYGTRPRRRRRLDRVDFQLRVFDLAEEGKTFSTIAAELQHRPSTIKSAFLVARRNVFGRAGVPSKKRLPLASFDTYEHVVGCPTCQGAQRFEQMCQKARLYANLDTKSQRELTGSDTT